MLNAQEIEEGLSSPNFKIRRGVIADLTVQMTEAQVERALTDPANAVRQEVVLRESISLTSEQITRGKNDPAWQVREAFDQRFPHENDNAASKSEDFVRRKV